LGKISSFTSFDALDASRKSAELSIASLRPKKALGLEVVKARSPDWREDEKEKPNHQQMQGDLCCLGRRMKLQWRCLIAPNKTIQACMSCFRAS